MKVEVLRSINSGKYNKGSGIVDLPEEEALIAIKYGAAKLPSRIEEEKIELEDELKKAQDEIASLKKLVVSNETLKVASSDLDEPIQKRPYTSKTSKK